MSKPFFSQVAANTPFDDTAAILGALNAQDAIDDALWFHRNYLPARVRPYFTPDGYQFRIYDCVRLDDYMIIDGSGVVF